MLSPLPLQKLIHDSSVIAEVSVYDAELSARPLVASLMENNMSKVYHSFQVKFGHVRVASFVRPS